MGFLTLWQKVNGRPGNDHDDLPILGRMLAELHKKEPPSWLRQWEPLRKVPKRLDEIDRQGMLPEQDRAFLRTVLRELSEEVAVFAPSPAASRSMCHGDAHTGNMILLPGGGGVLVDWEDSSIGPPEWDLGETTMSWRRFGLSTGLYHSFARAYGREFLESDAIDLMERVRELTATSWLLQNGGSSPEVLQEGKMRIRTMRDPSDKSIWSAF
jgi:aminoglycoside phosphotransferase (APT) family kinase protein